MSFATHLSWLGLIEAKICAPSCPQKKLSVRWKQIQLRLENSLDLCLDCLQMAHFDRAFNLLFELFYKSCNIFR
jgi:hypothetical protein